ncbi:MAG TPA: F0F1 ATP synthase subunit B [Candidatus Limnocylindrales bacterium]|nr:F0F1 ATP synthase subunit B [Candidatus Limnocylindrales bacterium]
MKNQSTLKRLLVLALVIVTVLAIAVPAFAQDATPVPEAPTGEVAGEVADAARQDIAVTEENAAAAEAPATSPLTPLGINAGFLAAQCINFLIIFGILGVVLWRPMMNMLDSRSNKIAKGLEDAAAAASARQNAEAEAEKILASARLESNRVIEEARGKGDEVAKQVQVDAAKEADKIREEARTRSGEERDRQLADLRGQVASISVAMTEALIGATMDDKRQAKLVSDFFATVPKNAVKLGDNVEVVSAMPLTAEEQARVQKETGAKNVAYSVDPSILGGLVVRSNDRVVDGSVRANLNELAGRLR